MTPAGRDLQIAAARNLVREHREAVAAMEQMYAERDEHNRNRIREFEKLVSDISYGIDTGMPPTAFMLRVETLLDDFKFSGLSAAGGTAGVQRSPVDGSVAAAVPARPVVVSSPLEGDRPGTDPIGWAGAAAPMVYLPLMDPPVAMGRADYARQLRWEA